MNQKVKGLIIVAIVFAVVVFSGCPPEDEWEPGYLLCSDKCEGESSGDVKNSQGSAVSGYDYLDVVKGYSVSIVGTTVTGVIKVQDIPDTGQLTFNHTALGSGYLNYEWALGFDTDGDGDLEYTLSVLHFKNGGQTVASIDAYTQKNLWKSSGGSMISIASAALTLDAVNDTFTIEATHAEVSNLVGSDVVVVKAYMNDGSAEAPFRDCCWY